MSQKSLTWRFFTLVFFWMGPFPTCIIHIMDSVFYKVYFIYSILCRILFLYYNFKFSLIVFIFIALYSINISSQSAITLKWGGSVAHDHASRAEVEPELPPQLLYILLCEVDFHSEPGPHRYSRVAGQKSK